MAPASPSRTGRYSPGARVALLVLLAIAFVLCTAWLDGGKGIVPPTLWTHPAWLPWWDTPLRMFCNALPALLLAFVLFAWTRRAGWSFLLAFALQAVLYGVNALKVQNLGAPLMPADFRMLGQLGKGGGDLLSGYLPHIALLVVGLLACIAVLVAWFRFEPPMLEKRPRIPRFAVSAVLLAALVTLVVGVPFWRGLYNAKLLGLQPWSPTATRPPSATSTSMGSAWTRSCTTPPSWRCRSSASRASGSRPCPTGRACSAGRDEYPTS